MLNLCARIRTDVPMYSVKLDINLLLSLQFLGDAGEIASQLMQNPGVLAALQDKLGSMVGSPSGYIQRYVHRPVHLKTGDF